MPVSTFLNGRGLTRGLLWLALSEKGFILTRSSSSDGAGGSTETYTKGSAITCRIDALAGEEGEQADRISDRSTHIVTCLAGTEITADDDFEIEGVGRFEVTAVRSHTGEMATQFEVTDRT